MQSWDTAFPHLLSKLHELEFDYNDGEGVDFEPYDAFLPAEDTGRWFKAWTGNREADGSRFRIFGQDGSGGYAAIWCVSPAKALLEQPIVFLGSEGERGVIADNFAEYLWLLAGGLGPYEAIAYPGLDREPDASFTEFARDHADAASLTPAQVLAKANAAHPDFSAWIEEQCR